MFTINHILREVTFFVNVFLRKIEKKVIFRTIFINCIRKREKRQTIFGGKSKNAISIVARGPVPRETLNRAEMAPFYRSAGACPPRSLICLKQGVQDYLPRSEHFFPMDTSSGP